MPPVSPTSDWPWPPLLRGSVSLHVAALGALAISPTIWPWAFGGLVLNHAVITAAGLTPKCDWLGMNHTRLSEDSGHRGEVALTIDDGPDPEVTPQVLDLLELHGARATFFCIAEKVERHAALAREIVARGHAIENHTAQHRHHFSLLGPGGFAREIVQAQQMIEQSVGRAPQFFRAPAGLRNPFLAPVLHRLNLQMVSWTRRGFDTRERKADVVLRRLTKNLAGGDILLLHDGNAARTSTGAAVVLEALPKVLERIRRAALMPVLLSNANLASRL